MRFLDWLSNKQKKNIGTQDKIGTLNAALRSIDEKVKTNEQSQIQMSAFDSTKQRDSLVMQRILGQQPRRVR